MKAFVASVIFIILIVILVLANMFYVGYVTDNMKRLAREAVQEESSDKELSELVEYWDKHKSFIALSANFRQTDIVSEELIKLQAAHTFDNRLAIEQSYMILCDVLDDIAQYERFSLDAIL